MVWPQTCNAPSLAPAGLSDETLALVSFTRGVPGTWNRRQNAYLPVRDQYPCSCLRMWPAQRMSLSVSLAGQMSDCFFAPPPSTVSCIREDMSEESGGRCWTVKSLMPRPTRGSGSLAVFVREGGEGHHKNGVAENNQSNLPSALTTEYYSISPAPTRVKHQPIGTVFIHLHGGNQNQKEHRS